MKGCLLAITIVVLTQFFVLAPHVYAADVATGISQLAKCSGPDCTACNAVYLANGLITWLIGMAFLLFALLFCFAGVRMVVSGGNSHTVEEAKNSFVNAVIGLIIVLAAWLIVDTVMRSLVGTPGREGQLATTGSVSGWLYWSEVQCQVQTKPNAATEWKDPGYLLPAVEAELQESVASACSASGLTPAQLKSMGCTFDPCTTTACLTSCMNILSASDVGLSGSGKVCANTIPSSGGTVTRVPVSGMTSLRSAGLVVADWPGINGPGRTDLANPAAVRAALAMQNAGKARFGKQPFQITAAYTDGVGHHDGSQHYAGLAVDFQPINGVTYEQVAQLAHEAGFHFVLIEAANHHVHADMR